MRFDLKPLLRGEVDKIEIDCIIPKNDIYDDTDELGGDVRFYGKIFGCEGYVRLEAILDFVYSSQCSRCLDPVSVNMEVPFNRTLVTEGKMTDEQLEEDFEEYAVIKDGYLDIDEALRETVILSFPMRVLCSEDCPGLCPICGKHRRDGDCGCREEKVESPWDKLSGIKFSDK